MISKIEGIHNGFVLVVFDYGYHTVNVSNVWTNIRVSFCDNPELLDLYRLFVENFHDTVTFDEACLFFKKDLIK